MWRAAVWLLLPAILGAANTEEQREREERLANSLLAPCCYAEPVSRHASEAAVRMRIEIARLVEEGRSDQEIIDMYKQRYGARVYSPPKDAGRWAYLVPWMALLCGLGLVVRWLKRRVAPKQVT
jgi:cytochrome c-type biogenesis protein CcmH/NrfF